MVLTKIRLILDAIRGTGGTGREAYFSYDERHVPNRNDEAQQN